MSAKKKADAPLEAAEAAATEERAQVTKPERAEPVAYIGPTIKNVAASGTIYTGGIPEALSAKAVDIPAIKGLLVPVSALAKQSVAVQTAGTGLNALYNTVAAKLQ